LLLLPVLFLPYSFADLRALLSFPTRRSSDLAENLFLGRELSRGVMVDDRTMNRRAGDVLASIGAHCGPCDLVGDLPLAQRQLVRSEEHTSELQSRENLVCRLLLEKKKSDTRP